MTCPVTSMMRHLRRFAGLPVPYVQLWRGDVPDFRIADPKLWLTCIQQSLCPICGTKLGLLAFWIGGPGCRDHELFTDSAMHLPCARSSMRLCPFLDGRRDHYRGTDLPEGIVDASGRPSAMYLMRGKTANMRPVRNGSEVVAVHSGKLEVMEEF